MLNLVILIGILIALFLALRWFTRSNPASVSKALRRLGLAALVALGLWLVLTGKVAGLFAVAAGLAPWIMRALRLHSMWKSVGRMGSRTAQASPGNKSSVQTRFFRMSLDHDTGELDGEILEGPGKGSLLSQVNFEQAMDLWSRAQVDPPSLQVLESWLDRTWPDWREKAGAGPGSEQPSAAGTGAMTRDEAWEILGLQPNASADDIKAAHRRLMRMVHPDHGGSTWLASRINQARDLLLG